MSEDSVRTDIDCILKDGKLSTQKKIELLRKMHTYIRAQQRTQTESAMIDDPDTGSELRDVENALESLGADPVGPEDTGAATL
jgi:hypothetical protein